MNPIVALILCLAALFCGPARADAPDEAQQLKQRRAAVEARFLQDSHACQDHFQVNSCMDRVRAERVAALKPLLAREQELDAQDRKARSDAQAKRVAERQREFEAEEGRRRTDALGSGSAPGRSSSGSASSAVHALVPGNASSPHAPPVDPEEHARSITRQADEAAATAARDRQQLSQRQRLVLQHQQDFQRHQEEREASKRKQGKPLPIPSAAEIAAAASAASAGSTSGR